MNEGELHKTYSELHRVMTNDLPEYDYEFIFVDDGSRDNSLGELMEIQAADTKVKVIKLSRNFGQFAAINCGVHHITGDLLMVISADSQEPPELLSEFTKKVQEGYDVVIAERIARSDSIFRNIVSRIYYGLLRIENPEIPIGGFDCFMLTRPAVDAYLQLKDLVRVHQVDITWLGFKKTFIPYERRRRSEDKSEYNFSKLIVTAFNGILNSSIWPIRFIMLFGVIVSISGFIFAGMILRGYLLEKVKPQGWTAIMMTMLIIGGVTIVMLGVIGEYIWRIYYEAKGRPLYIVDKIISSKKKPSASHNIELQ